MNTRGREGEREPGMQGSNLNKVRVYERYGPKSHIKGRVMLHVSVQLSIAYCRLLHNRAVDGSSEMMA